MNSILLINALFFPIIRNVIFFSLMRISWQWKIKWMFPKRRRNCFSWLLIKIPSPDMFCNLSLSLFEKKKRTDISSVEFTFSLFGDFFAIKMQSLFIFTYETKNNNSCFLLQYNFTVAKNLVRMILPTSSIIVCNNFEGFF